MLAPIWVVGFALSAERIALTRFRSRGLWWLFGSILGPIAIALLLKAPPGRCMICGERVRGWPSACASCGASFALAGAARTDDQGSLAATPAAGSRPALSGANAADSDRPATRSSAVTRPDTPRATKRMATKPSANQVTTTKTAPRNVAKAETTKAAKSAATKASKATATKAAKAIAATKAAKATAATKAADPDGGAEAAAVVGTASAGVTAVSVAASTGADASGGTSRPSRPQRAATSMGVRVGPVSQVTNGASRPTGQRSVVTPSVTAQPDPVALEVAGVFVSGNGGLDTGARYILRRAADRLAVLGPVDRDPNRVVVSFDLASLDVTGMNERLILSGPAGRGRDTFLVFVALTPGPLEMVAEAIAAAVVGAASDATR